MVARTGHPNPFQANRSRLASWGLLLVSLGFAVGALVPRPWPAQALLSLSPPSVKPELNQVFSMDGYRALAEPWLQPGEDQVLLSPAFQARKTLDFKQHYLAPWSPDFLASHLTEDVRTLEARVFANLHKDIETRQGFGPNDCPYDELWLQRQEQNLGASPVQRAVYHPGNRAIVLANAPVRLLPTADLYLQGPTVPGEGYPFDNLQNSVLWAGTPVYLLAENQDHSWCKVLTADCAGWVSRDKVARAGATFIQMGRLAVARRPLEAVLRTQAAVRDERGLFRFQAYVGAVYPQAKGGGILIPATSAGTGDAIWQRAALAGGDAAAQPWACTRRHAAQLWSTLLGRPYSWGNINFGNDCSAELKAFFTAFGLWLPRNSVDQKDVGPGTDLTALSMADRIRTLRAIGHPYLSTVWIDGHIMLYLGPMDIRGADGALASGFMSYQNVWGLRPKTPPDYRRIIGGSVLFPVLDLYPEHPELDSLANKSRFVVTHLDRE